MSAASQLDGCSKCETGRSEGGGGGTWLIDAETDIDRSMRKCEMSDSSDVEG